MHKSSYLRMEYLVKYFEPYYAGDKDHVEVLDIGSYNMNGTYRDFFGNLRYHYRGLDMSPGPNVDIVPKDAYCWEEIPDESYDLVISGQTFEHIEYPWITIKEVERILKPSGFCIIIVPNSGAEHRAPRDCYRYFSDGLAALGKWAGLKIYHVSVGGVPKIEGTDEWISEWNDACLVAQKAPNIEEYISDPFLYERRISTNGKALKSYKTWEIAVMEVRNKLDLNKPIVLFGAAQIGEIVLRELGEEKVYCFVDNSKEKVGQSYLGKKIISYEDFLKIHNQYNCIISASYEISLKIRQQLQRDHVECYMLFPEI